MKTYNQQIMSGLISHSAGVNSLIGEEQLGVTWGSKLMLFIRAAAPTASDRQTAKQQTAIDLALQRDGLQRTRL